jgi:hypothetical protein
VGEGWAMIDNVKQCRYDLMDDQQIDGDAVVYPDCLSIDLDDFINTKPTADALVYQNNVYRPDLFFHNKMGTNNLEDIVLWLNDVPSRRNMEAGMVLKLPMTSDINSYFIRNRKAN